MKKIILSNKSEIKIDDDELPTVIEGIQRGRPIKVRQGIFNPSFFVSIVPDRDRIEEFLSPSNNRQPLPLLNNVFEGIPLQLEDAKKRLIPNS